MLKIAFPNFMGDYNKIVSATHDVFIKEAYPIEFAWSGPLRLCHHPRVFRVKITYFYSRSCFRVKLS